MRPITFLLSLVALIGRISAQSPVSAVLQPYVDRHELAGAVALVTDGSGTISVDSVGFADISGGRAMDVDAMFWIASQSKAMTAAAVMMMVDEGRVALDDPVEKYLPEFRGQMVVAGKDDSHVPLRKPAESRRRDQATNIFKTHAASRAAAVSSRNNSSRLRPWVRRSLRT